MAKKKTAKKVKTAKKKVQAATKPDEEKPFDFGGLPDRSLKKNLGCG